jgi:hypothetical protein
MHQEVMKTTGYFNAFERKMIEIYNWNLQDEVVKMIRGNLKGNTGLNKKDLVEKTT